MSQMKVLRHLVTLMTLLLCLAPCLQGQETLDAREQAIQLAASINDNAVTLAERQEALRKLEEASRLFISVGEAVEAARVLNRAGRLHLILNAPQAALDSHQQALELLEQRPNREVEVDGLNGLGSAYMILQKKEQAEEVLQKALVLSEQSGYTSGQAQALLTLSDRQNYYDHPLAVQTALKSLTLWQTLNDKQGIARAYAKVGQYYMAQNLLPESTQNYESSLNLWRELNNKTEQAGVLIMMGFIAYRQGEWTKCISLQTQAQRLIIDEAAEPGMMGQITANIGEVFNDNGWPEVGLPYFQRALDFYRRTQDPNLIAYATWGLGVTAYLSTNYPQAITYFQQVLDTIEDDTLEAQCYEYLGKVYISRGENELALQNLQLALAMYTRAVNPREAAQVRGLMGQIAEGQGQLERARQYYRQALAAFTRLSDRLNQAAVYYALGRLELKDKNYDAAEDYLRQSIEVTENIRRVSTSSDLTAAFSATVYERYEKYIECLMHKHTAHPEQGFALRAFETSELARGRSLAELLRATETNLLPGLDPQLAEQEKLLRQSLRAKEDDKIALLSREVAYKKEELEALETEQARLEAEYKKVTDIIRARYPSYEQIIRPAGWDVRRIQEQVVADDQTVLLEYSLGADNSYVWAVTHSSIKSYELPAKEQIIAAAQRVYKLLATAPGTDTANELTAAKQELSQLVLSPVTAELNKQRIIVVADGVLHYIPFQILLSPSDSNEMLVANYEIINVPSASILGELRQEAGRRQPAAKILAAFGDPVFASNYAQLKDKNGNEQAPAMQALETLPWRHALRDIELNRDTFDPTVVKPLFYAKRELSNLRDVAAGGEPFVAADFAATREQLFSTDLTKYAILHFATHGFLDPKRPEYSGLVLSTVNRDGQTQNGFVSLQDIYQLHAPVDLVVLSACQTALGKDVRGEGLLGVTRGFMYAGASSVVASLWKVDDEATAELMKRFYANMLEHGMTPALALRAAQNSIRQEPQWRSPYYWAAFTLQGEYRQGIRPAHTTAGTTWYPRVVLGGALVMLSAGLVWYLYRLRRTSTARERGYSTVKK